MDSLEHSCQILSYWTPDRIASATPEDEEHEEVHDDVKDEVDGATDVPTTIPEHEEVHVDVKDEVDGATDEATPVPDVTKFPYQSVGKLRPLQHDSLFLINRPHQLN